MNPNLPAVATAIANAFTNATSRHLVAAALVAACAVAPTLAHAEKVAKVVSDYTVFVDPPTGFVFVKLPKGWKFVGKVGPRDVAKVPPQVVTELLTGRYDDEAPEQLAQKSTK